MFSVPGRCDFIRHDCVGGIVTIGGGPGSIEQYWIATYSKKMYFYADVVVAFLGHIVGKAGLACEPGKVSAVPDWHAPGSVKQVRQLVGFIGYY